MRRGSWLRLYLRGRGAAKEHLTSQKLVPHRIGGVGVGLGPLVCWGGAWGARPKKKRRDVSLPKGVKVESWAQYRKLLSGSLLQPKSFHYGGMGVAKPSVYLDLVDAEFRKKFKHVWQEHVEGCSDGKGYAKRKSKESNMLWKQRLEQKKQQEMLREPIDDEQIEVVNAGAKATHSVTQGDRRPTKKQPTVSIETNARRHVVARTTPVSTSIDSGSQKHLASKKIEADKLRRRKAELEMYAAMSKAASIGSQSFAQRKREAQLQGPRNAGDTRTKRFQFHL